MPILQETILKGAIRQMSIFDLPIETDERIKNKKQAMIFSDRIVCHPDLKKKLLEGLAGAKAQIAKAGTDIAEAGKQGTKAGTELRKRLDKVDMRDIAEQEEEEKGTGEASDLKEALGLKDT